MIEQLITLETAKLAKEAGFDWECRYAINEDGRIDSAYDHIFQVGEEFFTQDRVDHSEENGNPRAYLAPTQSLLQRWLREVHGWHIITIPLHEKWDVIVDNVHGVDPCCFRNEVMEGIKDVYPYFETHEEALEAGLIEVLRVVISNQRTIDGLRNNTSKNLDRKT